MQLNHKRKFAKNPAKRSLPQIRYNQKEFKRVCSRVSSAAWLSLDRHDKDPDRFLKYLTAAVHCVFPEFGPALEALYSVVGMRLACLSLAAAESRERSALSFSGSHRMISDVLTDEVVAGICEFMAVTALFERFDIRPRTAETPVRRRH